MSRFLLIVSSLAGPALAGAAAAQDPALSAVKFVGGDAAQQPAANSQYGSSVAAGGAGWLVSWTDARAVSGGTSTQQSDHDVYVRRLDAAGRPLDASSMLVNQDPGLQRQPQAAWNGQHWLLVWEDYAAGRIEGVRLDAGGAILDPTPIDFTAASTFSLAANGDQWLVVTENYNAGSGGLWGFRVAADGTELDPAGVLLVPPTYYLYFGSGLAAAGGEYLLGWSESNGIAGQRFDAGLQPLGPRLTLPARTFRGGNREYLFLNYDAASASLRAARMALDGTLLDPRGIALTDRDAAWLTDLDGGWDGLRWWTTWTHPTEGIAVCRVENGTALDFNGFDLGAHTSAPRGARLAAAAGGAALAWRESPPQGLDGEDIYARVVSGDLQVSAAVAASTGAPAQLRPEFAVGPDGYWLAYREATSGVLRAMVARLDGFGNALGPPIEVGNDLYALSNGPAIAWNGRYFLVVWGTQQGIVGRRLHPDGRFADAAPFFIQPGSSPDVEALDNLFLVAGLYSVYWEWRSVYGVRVDGDSGAVLDATPFLIGGAFAYPPRVGRFAGRWMVAYQQNWSHDSTLATAVAVAVNGDGTIQASTGLNTVTYTPDVAASDAAALFVYRSGSPATPYADIVGRIMLADGTLLPQFDIAAGGFKEMEPAVTWNGQEFVVAWEDLRAQSTYYDERTDLFGARVSAGGQVLDPGGFMLEEAPLPVSMAALASYAGRTLLAASFLRAEAPYANWRAGTRGIGAWADLGQALAGGAGEPILDAAGVARPGAAVTWALSRARPQANGAFVAGRARADLAYFGGVLVPQPERQIPFRTDADGRVERVLLVPPLAAGTSIYVQAWLIDPAAVAGRAASNALVAIVP